MLFFRFDSRIIILCIDHLVVEVQLLHLRAQPVLLVQETGPLADQQGPGGPLQISEHLEELYSDFRT